VSTGLTVCADVRRKGLHKEERSEEVCFCHTSVMLVRGRAHVSHSPKWSSDCYSSSIANGVGCNAARNIHVDVELAVQGLERRLRECLRSAGKGPSPASGAMSSPCSSFSRIAAERSTANGDGRKSLSGERSCSFCAYSTRHAAYDDLLAGERE
jgi:hypothetical protein